MTFLKWLFPYSAGGVVDSPSATSSDNFTIRYRIVPIPHSRWALEMTHFRFAAGIGIRTEWYRIAEYASPEEAQSDYRHLFCSPMIPIESENP